MKDTCAMGHHYGEGEVFRYLPIQSNLYNVLREMVIGFRDCYLLLEERGYPRQRHDLSVPLHPLLVNVMAKLYMG